MNKIIIIAGIFVVVILVIGVFSPEDKGSDIDFSMPFPGNKQPVAIQPPSEPRTNYPVGEKGPARILESGWKEPIKLGFNDAGWEDSPYITRDGGQILFFWHPVPNLADPSVIEAVTEELVANPQKSIENGLDGKIYISNRPFETKSIHPFFLNKDLPSSDACPYVSLSGDLYYCSTMESWVQGKGVPTKNYMNGKRLDFGTGNEENNFHLVESLDEGWGDCPGDDNICVMKNAKASDFSNKFELAPFPINERDVDGVKDFQPYLTDDGKDLYFTSNRDGIFAIYKTTRLDEGGLKWSSPVKFIEDSSGAGVAEVSITADGKELVFAQLFIRNDGSPGLDIYYSRKE